MIKTKQDSYSPWYRRAIVAAVATAVLALGASAFPMRATYADPSATTPVEGSQAAALWLAGQVGPDGWVADPMGDPSPGRTVSIALSLAAAGVGEDEFDRAVTWIQAHVDDYVVAGGDDSPGSLGYLLLLADAAGIDPTNFGGVDLVARVGATLGLGEEGLYGAADPTYDGVFRQSLVILGLAAAGSTVPSQATDWLTDQQCSTPAESTGGWQAYRGDTSVPCDAPNPEWYTGPDTNSTALAIMALGALSGDPSASAEIDSAIAFLQAAQDGDGGFAYVTGGAPDPNSTALVMMAIVAAGEDPLDGQWATEGGDPTTSLMSWYLGCDAPEADRGAFSSPFSSGAPDVAATIQATWGASGSAFPFGEVTFGPDPVVCATETTDTTAGNEQGTSTTSSTQAPVTTSTIRVDANLLTSQPARFVAAQPAFAG